MCVCVCVAYPSTAMFGLCLSGDGLASSSSGDSGGAGGSRAEGLSPAIRSAENKKGAIMFPDLDLDKGVGFGASPSCTAPSCTASPKRDLKAFEFRQNL